MDPWDEQDLRDHAIDRTGAAVDDRDRVAPVLGWTSLVLGVFALIAAVAAVRLLALGYPNARTGLTLGFAAVFLLVGCGVCAVCSAISAAELRIRRDR